MSLEKAKAELKTQIAKLESESSKLKKALKLLGGEGPITRGAKRKELTSAGRAKIQEAQKKRWAKFRAKGGKK